jgi:hypothetical protein
LNARNGEVAIVPIRGSGAAPSVWHCERVAVDQHRSRSGTIWSASLAAIDGYLHCYQVAPYADLAPPGHPDPAAVRLDPGAGRVVTALDRYIGHVRRFGPEGVLEVARTELGEDVYAQLLLSVAGTGGAPVIRCEGPGCFIVFEPSRKGRPFHNAACRQRAKRVRAGASYRLRPSNQHYQRVGTITAGGRFRARVVDTHEFRITPQGDALFGIYDRVSTIFHGHKVRVYQYVVQKVSLVRDFRGIHTGRLLFQWRSLKQVPVSQSYLPPPGFGEVWDYFHGNSIAQDTDGNLLVSARNTWGIYKINVKTGRIMWQLGAKGDNTLATPWCYQHDPVPLGSGQYSMFDDGGRGPGCLPGSTEHPSRGLIFQLNGSRGHVGVSLVRTYTHEPPTYVSCCGSMQRLANSDALIDWTLPEVTEYAPDGALRMDLSLSNWSYRAYRFPWIGEPKSHPAVAAQLSRFGTTVWASWNGSTEVAAWRVLAGPDPSRLSAVESPKPKRGFETPIFLRRPYTTVVVQALSAGGQVLATSQPVVVTATSRL